MRSTQREHLPWIALKQTTNKKDVPRKGTSGSGVIRSELLLDGSALGPFPLTTTATSAPSVTDCCMLSRLEVHPELEGMGLYYYQPKEPSPLQERRQEKKEKCAGPGKPDHKSVEYRVCSGQWGTF